MREGRIQLQKMIQNVSLMEANEMFTLSSGEKSKYYVDLKRIACNHTGSFLLGQELYMELHISARDVVGLELGAIPLVSNVAMYSYLFGFSAINGVMMRKKSKGHGTDSYFEGAIENGNGVAVLEDVVTTGASTQFVIDKLNDIGISPIQVVAVLDRSNGVDFGNIRFDSLFTMQDLI